MKNLKDIKRYSIALILVMFVKLAFASITFTGISDEKSRNSKYSLKNFSSFRHTFSLNSIKYNLHYTSSDILSQKPLSTTGVQMNSMMRYDRGNTTYIMPFSYKVKVPKFKTPSPVQ